MKHAYGRQASMRRARFAGSHLTAILVPISLFTASALARPVDPPEYTLTPLGTLGGENSSAYGLNNFGEVTGAASFDSSIITRGFHWANGVMADLGTLGGSYSSGRGVNDAGVISGWSQVTVGGIDHAVRWVGGVIHDLPHLGGNVAFGTNINNLGVMAGRSRLATNRLRACIWQPDDTIVNLGTLGGSESEAQWINNLGQVVGSSRNAAGDTHAFLYDNSAMSDLGTFGGSRSAASEINDAGAIVGSAADPANIQRAYIKRPTEQMLQLPSLSGNTEARALTEYEWIVGLSEVAPLDFHAVLWFRGDVWDLNDLVAEKGKFTTLLVGSNINERGQIIGQGETVDGATQAFILNLTRPYLLGPVDPVSGAPNTFTVYGLDPSEQSTLWFGFAAGSSNVPGCPGAVTDIRNALIAGTVTADAFGTATFNLRVLQPARAFTVLLQASGSSSCAVSNRIAISFN